MAAPAPHPLAHPGWVAFSLVVLAIPLAWMVRPAPHAPLPHLARIPAASWQALHGPPVALPTTAGIYDITAWPCASPCIARTGALAALAHGPSPPPLITVFTTPPDAHPALDAAQAVHGWSVIQVDDPAPFHAAWFAARGDTSLPSGGLMVVDATGSVRAVVAATPEGIDAARDAWDRLQSDDLF